MRARRRRDDDRVGRSGDLFGARENAQPVLLRHLFRAPLVVVVDPDQLHAREVRDATRAWWRPRCPTPTTASRTGAGAGSRRPLT